MNENSYLISQGVRLPIFGQAQYLHERDKFSITKKAYLLNVLHPEYTNRNARKMRVTGGNNRDLFKSRDESVDRFKNTNEQDTSIISGVLQPINNGNNKNVVYEKISQAKSPRQITMTAG